MSVKVTSDFSKIYKKLESKINKTQFILDEQILKDSNYYAPQDLSGLIDSSILATEVGSGQLVWDTPYARKLYWNPDYNFSTDKNPKAGGKWFEVAKSEHLDDWLKIAQSEINK